jgi:hypothetical protein
MTTDYGNAVLVPFELVAEGKRRTVGSTDVDFWDSRGVGGSVTSVLKERAAGRVSLCMGEVEAWNAYPALDVFRRRGNVVNGNGTRADRDGGDPDIV